MHKSTDDIKQQTTVHHFITHKYNADRVPLGQKNRNEIDRWKRKTRKIRKKNEKRTKKDLWEIKRHKFNKNNKKKLFGTDQDKHNIEVSE